MAGEDERTTEYIWLCSQCALEMHPEVEVHGDTIRLLLTKNAPTVADVTPWSPRVN
jgi:hypothetical protein